MCNITALLQMQLSSVFFRKFLRNIIDSKLLQLWHLYSLRSDWEISEEHEWSVVYYEYCEAVFSLTSERPILSSNERVRFKDVDDECAPILNEFNLWQPYQVVFTWDTCLRALPCLPSTRVVNSRIYIYRYIRSGVKVMQVALISVTLEYCANDLHIEPFNRP